MNLTKIKQKDIMDEIVPVYTTDTNIKVVNARDLYVKLEVKKGFTAWIQQQLKTYKEAEGVENTQLSLKGELDFDYFSFEIAGDGPRKRKEYVLTLDTAKEVAMMSRCEKGRAIRKYFIEIEKVYNKTFEVLNTNELSNEEKIAEALLLSKELIDNTKKELTKANRNKEYNKKVNVKLRREIKLLKAELEQAKNNPAVSSKELEEINSKLENAIGEWEYWESAYANLEIRLDNKESQLAALLVVKKDGKKYFNLLSQKTCFCYIDARSRKEANESKYV